MADRSRRVRLLLLATLALLLALAFLLARKLVAPTREALLAMPIAERRQMFDRAMADLRLCEERADPRLAATCRERAELVMLFPECTEACRERAQRFMPAPSR